MVYQAVAPLLFRALICKRKLLKLDKATKRKTPHLRGFSLCRYTLLVSIQSFTRQRGYMLIASLEAFNELFIERTLYHDLRDTCLNALTSESIATLL